jgi:lipopolysaccharide/colanic/teichoic acid biosynthesis glycosyltransferase
MGQKVSKNHNNMVSYKEGLMSLDIDHIDIESPLFSLLHQSILEESLGKRLFDIVFSLSTLLFLSPLYLLIALTIKICSPGPVLYSQMRIGKGGTFFKCYKFRTMHQNADLLISDLLRNNHSFAEEWHKRQKLSRDPRIFTWGIILRKLSLDELPQFYNVLKGDLSIVGPRPYMPSQLPLLGKNAETILSIKPGITGLWQTSGRSSTTFQRRIFLDKKYVEKRSFWLDIKLIMKTCKTVFKIRDAH